MEAVFTILWMKVRGPASQLNRKILFFLQLQPGRMSPSQFARVPGFVGSPLAAMNPKLLQGRVGQKLPPAPGFRAFFSAPPPATPPPPQQHPPGSGPHLQNLRYTESAAVYSLWTECLDRWCLVVEGRSLLTIFTWCILRCYLILKLPNTEMCDGLQGFIWITFPSSHVLPGLASWLCDKELPASAGEGGSIPGQVGSPGEGNGDPSRILVWKVPWTEGPDGLQSLGLQRVGHNWATEQQDASCLHLHISHLFHFF